MNLYDQAKLQCAYDNLNDAYGAEMKANAEAKVLIKCIQDDLGTAETGNALIEVARNAHKAEMELASTYNWDDES